MEFSGTRDLDVSHGVFNDVGQNQYNCIFQLASLESAFSTASGISSLVQQVKCSKEQLQVLAASISTLLRTLDAEYCAGRLLETKTSFALENLTKLLDDIYIFVHKETDTEFMKSLTQTNDRIAQIAAYYHELNASAASFQITSLDIQDWQRRNDEARLKDQKALHDRLNDLDSNQSDLKKMLRAQHYSLEAMMMSLQKIIDERSGGDRELKFFSNSVRLLSAMSRFKHEEHKRRESWTITSFDIEFGSEIGSGGYARVMEGIWNRTRVAVKVLKTNEGVTPSIEAFEREISTWSRVSHPHILQFLGANILDDKPFIVTPLMSNGNVRTYIQNYPDCDRLTMLYHISLGVVYLHSQNIIHGDLKAQNVLVDDCGRALLCDFGLARLKADITTRTTETDPVAVSGSRHWMAPERLMGKSLRKPSDIYSFGITLYEMYTNDVPFGHITPAELRDLVAHQHVRPERPEANEAPQLNDPVWKLAERCWASDPLSRPIASAICDDIRSMLDGRKSCQPVSTELPKARETSPVHQHDSGKFERIPLNVRSLTPKLTRSHPHDANSAPQNSSNSNIFPKLPFTNSLTTFHSSNAMQPVSRGTRPSDLSAIARTSPNEPTPSRPSLEISRPGPDTSSPPLQPSAQDSTPSNTSIIAEHSTDEPASSHLSSSTSACDTQAQSQPTSQGSILSNTSAISTYDTELTSRPASHGSTPSNLNAIATPSGSYFRDRSTSWPVSQGSMFSHPIAIWRPTADASTHASSGISAHSAQQSPQDASPSNQGIHELEISAAGKAQPTGADPILATTVEPAKEWKTALRKGIEECILPLYTEAWEHHRKILREIPKDDAAARKRVAEHHRDALQRICHIAEALYQDQVEEERQQLLWMQGGVVDHEWLEGLVRQQHAILELASRSGSQTSGINDDSDGQSSVDSDGD